MRKDVIIAVLATFCLTVMLFMVLPTRSGTSAGDYDSWADINDDGQINMYDIGYTAQRFGTSGDPTKQVEIAERGVVENVINFAIDEKTEDEQYPHVNITIPTAGFRILTVSMWVYQFDPTYFDYFIGYRVADRWVNFTEGTGFTNSTFTIISNKWWENVREPSIWLNWTEEIWFSELVVTIFNKSSVDGNRLIGTAVYYLST